MHLPSGELSFRDYKGARLTITGTRNGEPSAAWKAAVRIAAEGREIDTLLRADVITRMRQMAGDIPSGEVQTFPPKGGARLMIASIATARGVAVQLELATADERVDFAVPAREFGDLLDYAAWLIDRSNLLPRLIARTRTAYTLSSPHMTVEEAAAALSSMSDEDAARVLMGLASRNRLDLAVAVVDRLSRAGKMRNVETLPDDDFYEWEHPSDVSWADLRHWASWGTGGDTATSIARRYREIARPYLSDDYIYCFEAAFEERFEQIPFATLDVRDVQARLRRLEEYLDIHFDNVSYPLASPEDVIPHIVGPEQWTEPFGADCSQFLFTPPVWHEEARRLLLFASRVSFEDPLPQLIGPITALINNRSYSAGGLHVVPSQVHPTHIDLLRRTLTNAQQMARLIRAGVVIPHSLRTNRIPGFIDGGRDQVRFRDEHSRMVASDLATTLGALMSSGAVDTFGLPADVVERAKAVLDRTGGWQSVDWFYEFFDTHDDSVPDDAPIRLWPDHLYRTALYTRYFDTSQLGYAPHFLHPHGYRLYALLEAADMATASQVTGGLKVSGVEFARTIGGDRVAVSRLDPFVRPRLDVLSDADLVSMRMNDELFEQWRNVVRDSLRAVQNYEKNVGRADPAAVVAEVRDRLKKWEADSRDHVKQHKGNTLMELGEGAAVSVVTSLILTGSPETSASLAIGAAWTILRSVGRAFSWRKDDRLFRRHCLSVIDPADYPPSLRS